MFQVKFKTFNKKKVDKPKKEIDELYECIKCIQYTNPNKYHFFSSEL